MKAIPIVLTRVGCPKHIVAGHGSQKLLSMNILLYNLQFSDILDRAVMG